MAEISSITIPSGESYDLKDNSAVAGVTVNTRGLYYTLRDGTRTLVSLPSCTVYMSEDGTTLYIDTVEV